MNSQVIYTTKFGSFPYFCYDHPAGVKTTEEQEIEDEIELAAVFDEMIPRALKDKRRLVITDEVGRCLFHTENGQLIFPLPHHLKVKNGRWYLGALNSPANSPTNSL